MKLEIKIIISLLLAIGVGFFVLNSFKVSNDLGAERIKIQQESEIAEHTSLKIQKSSVQNPISKVETEKELNNKVVRTKNEITDLEMRAIQMPNLEENNSFQILQTMRTKGYSPNKDDWSYDSENYLTTYLADNPLSSNSNTKFLCDQEACLIESVLSSVDFSKTELGVSKEWNDFHSKLFRDENFKTHFQFNQTSNMVIPVVEENKQIRILLYLRK